MQEAIKYISDKLSPLAKLANKKLLVDYTFASPEDRSNDFEKAMLFYEILLLDESEMIEKLKQTKHIFSPEDVTLLMTLTTHLRKAIPEDAQNNYKKKIFSSFK